MTFAELEPRFFVTPWLGMPAGTSYEAMLDQRRAMGVSFNCPCGCRRRVMTAFAAPFDGGPATAEDLTVVQASLNGDSWDGLTLSAFRSPDEGRAWQVVDGAVLEVFG